MVAAALGLGQYFGDQVVAGVVLVVLAQQRQFFAGGVVVVQGFLCDAAVAVVAGAGVQLALGAQHFVVQVVALEVADHPAIEVDLVQVTAAVVQVVDGALVGQGQGFEVAQFVVVVFKLPGSAGFAEQLSVLVVVERQRLLLAVR